MNTPPPGFAQYPRPQGLPSGVRSLPPGAHFEAIGDAWTLFLRDWATWVGSSLIVFLVSLVGYLAIVLSPIVLNGGIGPSGQMASPILFIPMAILGLVWWFLLIGLVAGLVKMALKQIRGQAIAVGDVFGAFTKVPSLFIANICFAMLYMVGIMLCVVPGLWVLGAFSMTPFIMIDQDLGAIEALTKSYQVAGNFGTAFSMFCFIFVIGLILNAGAFFCGIGMHGEGGERGRKESES